jgi:hypothetical protein
MWNDNGSFTDFSITERTWGKCVKYHELAALYESQWWQWRNFTAKLLGKDSQRIELKLVTIRLSEDVSVVCAAKNVNVNVNLWLLVRRLLRLNSFFGSYCCYGKITGQRNSAEKLWDLDSIYLQVEPNGLDADIGSLKKFKIHGHWTELIKKK